MVLVFPGAVLMEFWAGESRLQGVRNAGGENEVKTVGLDSFWRKKEKPYCLEEVVGSHDHPPTNRMACIRLL